MLLHRSKTSKNHGCIILFPVFVPFFANISNFHFGVCPISNLIWRWTSQRGKTPHVSTFRGGPEQCGHRRGGPEASGQTQRDQLGPGAAVPQRRGEALGVLAMGVGMTWGWWVKKMEDQRSGVISFKTFLSKTKFRSWDVVLRKRNEMKCNRLRHEHL